MIDDLRIKAMLGISLYGIKILRVLDEDLPGMSYHKISLMSGVSYHKIYELIPLLQLKGYIICGYETIQLRKRNGEIQKRKIKMVARVPAARLYSLVNEELIKCCKFLYGESI